MVQSIILSLGGYAGRLGLHRMQANNSLPCALGNAQYPTIEAAPGRYVLVNLF